MKKIRIESKINISHAESCSKLFGKTSLKSTLWSLRDVNTVKLETPHSYISYDVNEVPKFKPLY